MNLVKTLDVEYITPSRTIETILISSHNKSKVFYMYNYEGNLFRLFESNLNFINFFMGVEPSEVFVFETDQDLDTFLMKFEIE